MKQNISVGNFKKFQDMRVSRIIAGILAVAMGLSSCVRDVIMDAKEKPKVVVSCILSNDPVQRLNLSFTKGASLSEAPPLTEAVATLYDLSLHNEMEAVGNFQRQSDGEWTLNYEAVPGHKYRLEVNVPGYEMIHAEQQMPSDAPDVEISGFSNIDNCVEPWSGWVYKPDPAGDWIWRIWPEDEEQPHYETIYFLKSAGPVWICAMNYNKDTGRHEPAEYICTNAEADVINITDKVYEPLKKDVPMPFKLSKLGEQRISPEVFYNAHQTELYPSLEGRQLYRSYIRLAKGRQIFSISASFTGEYHEGDYLLTKTKGNQEFIEDKGYICISVLSDDYDKYLTDSYFYRQVTGSSDISTIYLRDNIFTNISGGLGIFGAQLSGIYPWSPTYTYVDLGDIEDLEKYIMRLRSKYSIM